MTIANYLFAYFSLKFGEEKSKMKCIHEKDLHNRIITY